MSNFTMLYMGAIVQYLLFLIIGCVAAYFTIYFAIKNAIINSRK